MELIGVFKMTSEIESLQAEIESLKQNRINLAKRLREVEKYIDTVSSPLWKRIWFVLQGYKFNQLGRWYTASWNSDAKEWD